jgi:hypothetical protein
MKGQVLGFDGTTGAISADGGERYSFALADWKGERPPQPRDTVDFIVRDGAATEVYPTASSLGAAFSGLSEGLRNSAGSGGGLAMIAGRPQLVLEALALIIAVLFSYIAGPMGPGISMLSFPNAVSNMSALGGGLGFVSVLAYLLWLIPIGAASALYLDLTGKRNTMLELGLGGLCVFSLVVYFLMSSAISSAVGPFGAMAASMISLGFGGYLIVLVGIGLILTGLGKLNRIPGL